MTSISYQEGFEEEQARCVGIADVQKPLKLDPAEAVYAPMLGKTSQSFTWSSGSWWPVSTVSSASHVGPNTVDPYVLRPRQVGLPGLEAQASGIADMVA